MPVPAQPSLPAAAPAPRRRHTAKGERTRAQILDAAETLFAQRGYEGVSLREILELAGVQMGQLQHYFPAKEAVFMGVIERRVDAVSQAYGAAVAGLAAAAANGTLTLRLVARAMMAVSRDWQGGEDIGRQRYLRMTGLSLLSFSQPDFIAHHRDAYAPLNARIIDWLGHLYPHSTRQKREAAFYFMESNLLSLFINIDSLFARSGAPRSRAAVELLFDELEDFLTAGVAGLLATTG